VRALLISTYDLGRQPLGLAAPAAWLRQAAVEVDCIDTSREPLTDAHIHAASLVAFYLPMHTATRLAAPLIERVRAVNPGARVVAYGLYAPLNRAWLEERGASVLGPDAEQDLVALAGLLEPKAENPEPKARSSPFLVPDRTTLPPLTRYAAAADARWDSSCRRQHRCDAGLQASLSALPDRAGLSRAVQSGADRLS
jgi:hypothetical protein